MAFRNYIFDNLKWKLLSLLLAALTWLTITTAVQKDETSQKSPVVTSSKVAFPMVPVTLMTSALNTNRFKVTPTMVLVEVSGKTNEVANLQINEVHAFVDVTDMKDETQMRKPVQTQVPGNVKVSTINPQNVLVERITTPK
jgi:mRNA-degrading endonuclease toxin of MazEF toxin-antitoxin module